MKLVKPGNYQAKLYAYELERSYASDHVGKLAGLLFDAKVEPKPHQIDAALFALQTPFLNGVILADEVGLGKTIEAGIIISQYWAERKQRILIIAPSSLRQQWRQELDEKFAIPASLLEKTSLEDLSSPATLPQVLICSYEFANTNQVMLAKGWDLVVCDEAHRLRSNWTGKAKIPQAVASICKAAEKSVMLTATPLQNRLEELYGLVSVFDPGFFFSLEAFKSRYIDGSDEYGNDDLAARVAMLAKRTLRKDANKYIRFTERTPMTFAFTPSDEEIKLYDLVNDYLQRDEIWAFAKSQRHLSSLIVRKRLGSSSFALASTLERIADRLSAEIDSGKRLNNAGVLLFDTDVEGEIQEASDFQISNAELISPEIRQAMYAEVCELRDYARFARCIEVNQKALILIDALEQGFAKLREIGAPEKAIIFTDSTVTQEYLAKTLREYGWGDELVLFNGVNNSSESNEIYKAWLEENRGSDIITGIIAADKRKALVDAFRDRGRIMIATEAAAEGINLQFCSMLVNYDLPWNPQRVEQRIGRVHRFGQKHNVFVVNFSNKGNKAEERILELLTEKFQLFTSVFGASDEVLGQIEDGLDFERSIVDILQRCKTAEEIDTAFNELEKKYASQIDREMRRTRSKVFDNLDPKVRDKLKTYDIQTGVVLNAFERMLLEVTKQQLHEYASFLGEGTQFSLNKTPKPEIPVGDYFFKSSPRKGAHQYRYNSELCRWVLEQAKDCETPAAELTFSLQESDRVSALAKKLKGASGVLTVELLSFGMQAGKQGLKESYLLMAGVTDNGVKLDSEQVRDLLDLKCTGVSEASIDRTFLSEDLEKLADSINCDVVERNAAFLFQQEALIDAERRDRQAIYFAKIKDLETKEFALKKQVNQAADNVTRLKLTLEARKIRAKIEQLEDEYRVVRNRLRQQSEEKLNLVAEALEPRITRQHLYTVRWRVTS